MLYLSAQESPRSYQFWCAVSAIGAALGRGSYIDRMFYTLYPNQFIILLGPSGITRKSIPIDLTTKILREVGCIHITSDKLTPEYLMTELSTLYKEKEKEGVHPYYTEAFCYAEELVVFIGDKESASRIIPLLTKLFNCPDQMKASTKTGGSELIERVCIHLLGGTTRQWLERCIPSTELGAGFAQRIIFVPERQPHHSALFFDDLDPVKQEGLYDKLVMQLENIHLQEVGEYKLTQGAKKVAQKFYDGRNLHAEESQLGFIGRIHDHVFRLAMVLSASSKKKGEIDEGIMSIAIKHITDISNRQQIVHQRTDASEHELTVKIMKIICGNKKRTSHTELMRKVWRYGKKETIDPAINQLHEMGYIEIVHKAKTRMYQAKGTLENLIKDLEGTQERFEEFEDKEI